MPDRKQRRVFDQGHKRKYLVAVDETPECEPALAFAAHRAAHTGGGLALLFIIEPADFQHWLGVEETFREEQQSKAKALFRLYSRKLKSWGFEDLQPENIVREGDKAEVISKLIEADEDIAILVLGASADPAGPGPLVSSLTSGAKAGMFPIPITIVPGALTADEVAGLA